MNDKNIELKNSYITIRGKESLGCQRWNAEAMMTIMGDTENSDEHSTFVDVFMTLEQIVLLRESLDSFIFDELNRGE